MIKLQNIIKEIHNNLNMSDDMRITVTKYKKPIDLDTKRDYKLFTGLNGLWYGFGTSWINYIKQIDPKRLGNFAYEVIIPTNKKILKISNYNDLIGFVGQFRSQDIPFQKDQNIPDWEKVSKIFDGIEFIPFFGNRGNKSFPYWYNQLDVSSGCVWNLNGVSLKPI